MLCCILKTFVIGTTNEIIILTIAGIMKSGGGVGCWVLAIFKGDHGSRSVLV